MFVSVDAGLNPTNKNIQKKSFEIKDNLEMTKIANQYLQLSSYNTVLGWYV
jgi:hypothetical protein